MINRSLFMFGGLLPAILIAQPTGPNVAQGSATFSHPTDHHMVITTGDKTIINWETFSINQGEITRFNQLSNSSTILNRVTTAEPSQILGSIESNGHVFLINPNGILFGKECVIDTNVFLASTLDVLDSEFMSGGELHFRGNSDAHIINLGTVQTKDGDITLIGRHVTNKGFLHAPKGSVSLAVGQEVLLKPAGKERVFICAQAGNQSQAGTGIINSGSIKALKTRLLVDGNPYKYAINHTGSIDALHSEEYQGDVYLVAEGGAVEVRGEICAHGGNVHVLGSSVALLDKGKIDISADRSVGEILFGGSYQGKDPNIYHSNYTFVGPDAEIEVSANLEGNGGRAVVWSDGNTEFYGSINAKGGKRGGNGGEVEVSGKESLVFKGPVDRSAPYGIAGTLLLDPSDITICSSKTTNMSSIGGPAPIQMIYQPQGASSSESSSQLLNTDLIAAVSSGPVIIMTSSTANGNGDIFINAPLTTAEGYTSPHSLTFYADRDIIVTSQVQNGGTGDINFQAERDLYMDGTNSPSTLGSRDGLVNITAHRNVLLSGKNYQAQIGCDAPRATGDIHINAGKDLILQSGKSFALIGHTNTSQNPNAMIFKGDIEVNSVGRNILLSAGDTDYQYCQIGHATPNFSPGLSNEVTAKGNITINNVSGSITLAAGESGDGTYTMIGHGGRSSPYNTSLSGDISVVADGPIHIFGAFDTAPEKFCGIGFAQDFSGVASHTFQANRILVQSKSDIMVRAGRGNNHSFIGVFTGVSEVGSTYGEISNLSVSGSNVNLYGDSNGEKGSDAFIGIEGSNHSITGSIDVTAENDLNILAGLGRGGESNAYITSDLGDISILVKNGNANIRDGVRSGKAYIRAGGDLSLQVSKGACNITSRGQGNIKAGQNGHIYSGNDLNLIDASITAHKHLTIESNSDIHFANQSSIQNEDGLLTVIAGNSIHMSPNASICNLSEKETTIVVDHKFPTAPSFGPGKLTMPKGSSITSLGPLRLYTSKQNQNHLEGTINGSSFEPGLLFSDRGEEQWLTYFSNSLSQEDSFTIYYKDGLITRDLIESNQLIISEMLTDLHPYSEYLGWFMEFQTAYDTQAYKKHTEKGLSSFEVNPDQMYYLRMKQEALPTPKSSHFILFPKTLETEPKLGRL